VRSGSQALSILAVPLNVHVLQALDGQPMPLPGLRRAVGHPPVTTMRSYLRNLTELGVTERLREGEFPGSVSYSLTRSGKKLLAVAEILRQWLSAAPGGTVEWGSTASRSVVKALVDGWDACIIRALAARPLALTELDRLIAQTTYPALERRLTAMRQVGLVVPDPEQDGRVARCRVTPWLRQAVAPLSAAVGWEGQYLADQAPAPGRLDAEAAFLLAIPLLELPAGVEGTCRLAVEVRRGSDHDFAGVTVTLEEGRIRSCATRAKGTPDAWATGGALDWFRWLREVDGHRIEVGGDPSLAEDLKRGLRGALLPIAQGASPRPR
jgi:DNA-binding HxlR family transcriptional regulator